MKYSAGTTVIALAAFVYAHAFHSCTMSSYFGEQKEQYAHSEKKINQQFNAESTLSLEQPILLAYAMLPELELIPALGPKSAEKLYNKKDLVVARASQMNPAAKAIELIHGIGPKMRKKIEPWLVLSSKNQQGKNRDSKELTSTTLTKKLPKKQKKSKGAKPKLSKSRSEHRVLKPQKKPTSKRRKSQQKSSLQS